MDAQKGAEWYVGHFIIWSLFYNIYLDIYSQPSQNKNLSHLPKILQIGHKNLLNRSGTLHYTKYIAKGESMPDWVGLSLSPELLFYHKQV